MKPAVRQLDVGADVAYHEQASERRVVNWIGMIAVMSIVATVVLVMVSSTTEFGVDTAVIVALVGIIAQATSALGTRRARFTGDPGGVAAPAVGPPPVE